MAALSFDGVDALSHFAQRAGIQYPLLSDPESKVIRAFGILNETVPPTHQSYGIPHPGEYLIDENGIVTAKFFEQEYADRYTAGQILVRELGGEAGGPRTEKETEYLRVTTWASDETVRGGNRVALVLDVDLKPQMHVYAPGVEGYIPVEWTMEKADGLTHYPPRFPESELLHLPAINEIVPVYHGKFRLFADLMLGQPKEIEALLNPEGELVVRGSLRYQACDDKVCYLPQTVPLEWKFRFEAHDRTRVPEPMRRQGGFR